MYDPATLQLLLLCRGNGDQGYLTAIVGRRWAVLPSSAGYQSYPPDEFPAPLAVAARGATQGRLVGGAAGVRLLKRPLHLLLLRQVPRACLWAGRKEGGSRDRRPERGPREAGRLLR